MKQIVGILVVFFIFSGLLIAKAEIRFEKKEVSFGEIDEGQSADLVFKFKNTGDSLLVIKSIRPSCGCTVTQLKKRRYKPGEEGMIPVKFLSRGYGGKKVYKSIAVASNDPDNSYIRLKIVGKVTLKNFARIEIKPSKITFKTVSIKKQYSKKIYIRNTGNIDLEIKELSHIPEIIPIFSSSIIKPSQQAEVKIIFKPTRKQKTTTFIKIRTNDYRHYYTLLKIELK
ncbi:MAG: DUF1573 domain-containing protein [Candidatus Aminicenantes bacterium]|nr:DUF1573 domain-containing protein [Candidatus Aminicenantes bacterium]